MVWGDAHGIPRLLSILLENASKYTPPGGAVKLSATGDGERIVFSVQDTGIGIAPEHRLRVFDRFFRATQPRKTVATGSGLGLALGKWIAERHSTELRVVSEPGHGSIFSFSLKRTNAIVQAVDAGSNLGANSEARLKQFSSCTL
jgi:signal transduction histidine kinase